MTALPHAFKRIRLNLARSKEFPQGSQRHGYEFVAPLDRNGHIDAALWNRTAMPAASDDSGKANLMSTAFSSIAPEGPSTGAGYSITMKLRKMTMKAGTASARMHFARANTSRFATRKATCIPSR